MCCYCVRGLVCTNGVAQRGWKWGIGYMYALCTSLQIAIQDWVCVPVCAARWVMVGKGGTPGRGGGGRGGGGVGSELR